MYIAIVVEFLRFGKRSAIANPLRIRIFPSATQSIYLDMIIFSSEEEKYVCARARACINGCVAMGLIKMGFCCENERRRVIHGAS